MAIDHGLLDLAQHHGGAYLRMYRWHPACLSFGRNEPALRRYDRSRIEAGGLDLVRRPTGGRGVWHGNDLTYAVAAPIGTFGSLTEAYRMIHLTLARALRRLGADARCAHAPRRAALPSAGACFASAAGGEVLVAGRKVAGSAQLAMGDAFLQHGSVLLNEGQERLNHLQQGGPGLDHSVSLSAVLGRTVRFDEVAQAIALEARAWSLEWGSAAPGPERVEAVGPHEGLYRSEAWTWRR
jgi:lipoate-protein ligase A